MTEGSADDDLLVGNPERERAIALLTDAFVSGYLQMAEFEDRSGAVYASRTRGELRAALDQLPTAGSMFGHTAPTLVPSGEPVEFNADWTTVRRRGRWEVPPRMRATGSLGTVNLDFREAVFASHHVELELHVSTSTVKLMLGPDQSVHLDGLKRSGASTIKDKAGAPQRPGGAEITVTGSVSAASSVVIKRR
ncbi:DUF1707 SHOCT-like domain-containing protein [Gordonia sp. (in: high G+C Gram-positive bacteria)]|uniref:DUF1707 SHOCT-like domain-containing protein n=1 Tax=Gordonia sp. (in: high G+C Gram-positive bacteria) TaxID=84139 RepID=UPI0039E61190